MFGEKLREAPARLIQALKDEGFSMSEILYLAENRVLLKYLKGAVQSRNKKRRSLAEVKKIDLSKSPFIPEGFQLKEHKEQKTLTWNPLWNPGKIWFFSSRDLEIETDSLLSEVLMKVDEHHALNANMLDFYLKEPELIPRELIGCETIFSSTRFMNGSGTVLVRVLYYNSGSWDWAWMRTEDRFLDNHRIAVFSGS